MNNNNAWLSISVIAKQKLNVHPMSLVQFLPKTDGKDLTNDLRTRKEAYTFRKFYIHRDDVSAFIKRVKKER